ncbi:glutamate racemase [Ignatzschineria sp. LJL83]
MLRIGLIDSGIGGFSILNAFLSYKTPIDAEFLYIADSGHLPYGLKSDAYIHERMRTLTAFLITKKIDALVIACNTATAVSAKKLRAEFPNIILIGTEPAIKPATLATKTGHIAVAATQSTLNSDRLNGLITRFAQNCTVHKIIGTSWVELVESQKITPSSNISILSETLQVFNDHPIDQLVLGCTHFPFLAPALDQLLSSDVAIIDPASSIVQECYHQLSLKFPQLPKNGNGMNTSALQLFTTGSLEEFSQQSSLLLKDHQQLIMNKINA